MKSEQEREQLIKDINVLLNQAYDSTLDEIYAFLKKIEDEEDEEDLKAYEQAKKSAEIDGSMSWEEAKKELETERKKEVA
ncbi:MULTISPECIES: hypothetical protein [Chlorogloeopsis]|jgi:hypothetical protein|uniref:Uncharacterized protein n=1 Tax=Chlorogloeopsis fritschii PCC 6912 TaxID=211165 RepID=A0A433NKS7_CHLFR|nr:hypothetical protein [Chlorogloeopsis fritschii]MBF2004530.1 hypothetical protein [Chlorogloeopsis fritschii C42_A2020_084]RUR83405.1 hypothetical protein PCC6912_22380 [Chlorogloeopsis fritschii PCC 6912]